MIRAVRHLPAMRPLEPRHDKRRQRSNVLRAAFARAVVMFRFVVGK